MLLSEDIELVTRVQILNKAARVSFHANIFGKGINPSGGARGVMVIVLGNGDVDTSSNPGRDCISHSTNTLGKGMNPIILPPAMGK